MASVAGTYTESSLGLDYWLRRCHGFRVDGARGRLGYVTGVRFGGSAEPEALEVRRRLLGRRTRLIPISEVAEVVPEQRRLILG